ncbi:MAG: Fic family protein [Pirellulales bacterium]|nr:Fic family protein [Pirellulales bacterium]
MDEESSKRRDRYDVSGNVEAQFVDDAQIVLVNKAGIVHLEDLQVAEEQALARAYGQLLQEVRTDTPLSNDLLRHIHASIFGDLYDWAGRWRTVWISKPGTTWPPPDFLDNSMTTFERDVLSRWPSKVIGDDESFCQAIGEIHGEFLTIHPFREGNARTIKLMTDLLAIQTGRPLLAYDNSARGADAYIEAAKKAFKRDYGPLSTLIAEALARSR